MGVQLLYADRTKNMTYIFRHAEAAGIMIMLANEQYAGHMEHSWNTVEKMTNGVMHITSKVRTTLHIRPTLVLSAMPVTPRCTVVVGATVQMT